MAVTLVAGSDNGGRADARSTSARLQELQPIAERVGRVEPIMAGKVVVPRHRVAGRLEPHSKRPQAIHQQTRMSLERRLERVLDAQMHFECAATKPAATPRSQDGRLLD